MNSNFNDEQIRAYAAAFEEGDAIYCNGEWHQVVEIERDKEEGWTARLTTCVDGNNKIISFGTGRGGVLEGFLHDSVTNPYRVTTLEHYELQGGEKLVWLGEGGVMFGEVFETFVDAHGNVVYENEFGRVVKPVHQEWGVIPRYEQVKHSDNPPKNKPKFKVGDKVTIAGTFTGIIDSFYIDRNIYGVIVVDKDGESHLNYYWEKDLSLYIKEPKIKSSFERETEKIIKELHDTLVKKNADYGNSFTKSYEKWGMVSAIIRMEDKFNRLNQLYDKDSSEVDESLYDTVLDLAGYAILTARELKKGEGSGQD